MTTEYIQQMSYMAGGFLSRKNHGLILTEDEAMCYNSILNYLKQVNRVCEQNARRVADEEEEKVRNDEDDGAGGPAPNPSPPT